MSDETDSFLESVDKIIEKDSHYPRAAYFFVRDALNAAIKTVNERGGNKRREQGGHVTAAELIEGAVHFAREQFGPLAAELLSQWSLDESEDIGHVVYNLYEAGIFGKTESDERDDFKNDSFDLAGLLRNSYQPREETVRMHANAVENARSDFWIKHGTPPKDVLAGMQKLFESLKDLQDEAEEEAVVLRVKSKKKKSRKAAPVPAPVPAPASATADAPAPASANATAKPKKAKKKPTPAKKKKPAAQ